MSKKTVQVEVSAEISDVLADVTKLVAAIKLAVKSGGSTGIQLGVVLAAAVAVLPDLISKVQSIPADVVEDKVAAVKAVELGVDDLVAAILA